MVAPSSSTGTAKAVRNTCSAREFCSALPLSKIVEPCRLREIETSVTISTAALAPRAPKRIAAQSTSGSGR
jgi:hypothetical protein